MELITSKDQVAANLLLFDSYRSTANSSHHSYFCDTLRRGKVFVFAVHEGTFLFCPSRFAGYESCTAEEHQAFPDKDGKTTTPAISKYLGKPSKNEEAERAFLDFCANLGVPPSNKDRTYWRIEL